MRQLPAKDAFLIRFLLILSSIAVLVCLGLVLAVTDLRPGLPAPPPPSAEDVATTREIVHQIRAAAAGEAGQRDVSMRATDIGGGVRLGARFLPGLRAEARIEGGVVVAEAAVPLPWIGGERWLNLGATVPPFDDRIAPTALRLGPLSLPPGPTLDLARRLANLVLGAQAGDTILASAEAMRIEGDRLVFTLRLSDEDRGEVAQGVFAMLRGSDMPAPERIDAAYRAIRAALEDGRLPTEGSMLPHLLFTLDLAAGGAPDTALADRYTAAIFGLARACGGVDLGPMTGRLLGKPGPEAERWAKTCDGVTLSGRHDSRQHFIIAAAIQAASNRGFAVSIGEFKELHDTIGGGSGFDFTDIAANNSGIRLSDRMMAAPADDWPRLVALIAAETDVVAGFDGLPGALSEAAFAERFGSVDSPAYAAMLREIEDRIDALPIHAAAR